MAAASSTVCTGMLVSHVMFPQAAESLLLVLLMQTCFKAPLLHKLRSNELCMITTERIFALSCCFASLAVHPAVTVVALVHCVFSSWDFHLRLQTTARPLESQQRELWSILLGLAIAALLVGDSVSVLALAMKSSDPKLLVAGGPLLLATTVFARYWSRRLIRLPTTSLAVAAQDDLEARPLVSSPLLEQADLVHLRQLQVRSDLVW